MTLSADEQIERLRTVANEHLVTLIDRAKAAGQLRDDFVSEDLLLLLIANAAIAGITRAAAPNASRRLVALVLDAFGRPDATPLPAPPTSAQMASAMHHLAAERRCAVTGSMRQVSAVES